MIVLLCLLHSSGAANDKRAVWKDNRSRVTEQAAIGWKPGVRPLPVPSGEPNARPGPTSEPHAHSSRDYQPLRLQPDISDRHWSESGGSGPDSSRSYYVPVTQTDDYRCPSCETPAKYTNAPSISTLPTDPAFLQSDAPPVVPPPLYNEISLSSSTDGLVAEKPVCAGSPGSRMTEKNMMGSKSLPNSPIKRPVAGPSSQLNSTNLSASYMSCDPNGPISSHNMPHVTHHPGNPSKSPRANRYVKPTHNIEKETVL